MKLNNIWFPCSINLKEIDEFLSKVNDTLPKGVEINLHLYGRTDAAINFWDFNKNPLHFNTLNIEFTSSREEYNNQKVKEYILQLMKKNGYVVGGPLFEYVGG